MKSPRPTILAAALLLALVCVPTPARQSAGDVRRLSVPGQKWALEIALPGFVVQRDELRGDGKARMIQAADPERGFMVSVFYEPVSRAGKSAREYRDEGVGYIKAGDGSPFKIDGLKPAERGPVPTLEYFIREHEGVRVNQKHLNAYFVKEGMWADVHLSKVLFEAGDEKVFQRALDSVRFVEAGDEASKAAPASPPAAVLEHMREGSAHYLRGDYRAAIGPYRKALDLEKQRPQLERNTWRVLVDNLGMSYGITGDLENAKATFEYGLAQDPTYPMFHYLMACTHAEAGDLDGAIRYLKSAFANKRNMIPGERMPDPATDDSFRRFVKDEKFRAALKELDR